ncbi:MAG: DUF1257 domain-containing protein [Kofleriaceae bacterium]|nr:DUF1257 domain-containing protein [Myxococcales bacterium]MCB9561038.1 DUF1257 domain-containing protein [Kofleriaceae bacterium]
MSHFTKCELKMTNLAAIKKALEDLAWAFQEAEEGQDVVVRGYRGDSLRAAISVDMGKYDIGVIANAEGTYDLTADWWGVETTKGLSEAEVKEQLYQRYQYHNVKMACEEKGYAVEEETNEEDGSIRLVVRKWVSE